MGSQLWKNDLMPFALQLKKMQFQILDWEKPMLAPV